MVSHLQDMGFENVNSQDDLIKILRDNIEVVELITIGNFDFLVYCIDDCIQLWYQVEVVDEKIIIENFTIHYDTDKVQKITNPEWVYEDENRAILQVHFEESDYPLNLELKAKPLSREISSNRTYYCQIACFAEELEIFKTEEAFYTKHENMGIKSIIPIGTFNLNYEEKPFKHIYHRLHSIDELYLNNEEAYQTSEAWINGVVQSFERKINSYTGKGYYHIVLESLDTEFDILAAEELIDKPLEINDIISVVCWLSGKIGKAVEGNSYYNYVNNETMSSEDFIELIEKPMKALQDKPQEHIVVNFQSSEKMNELTFIQSARYDDFYLVEIGKDDNGEPRLYRLDELDLNKAIQTFYEVCVLKKLPDLSTWKDMTKEILKK